MDGDYPDLVKIAQLKKKYPFTWFLDEAHAVGWYGETGAGLAEEQAVLDQVTFLPAHWVSRLLRQVPTQSFANNGCVIFASMKPQNSSTPPICLPHRLPLPNQRSNRLKNTRLSECTGENRTNFSANST